eukprot:NODE_199_length_15263_cov_0.256331.p6 type:complete len:192 gc:universal NODE_199_length_15263_cov_0.256331:13523-12948(-)
MSDLSDWEAALTDEEEMTQKREIEEEKKLEEKKKLEKIKAEKDKLKKENEEFEKLDAKAKKLKLKEIEIKNDAQNTLDLFGVSPTKDAYIPQTYDALSKIEVSKSTDIQRAVDELSKLIQVKDKVKVEFYQLLMKELLKDVNYMEIREITSTLDTMANEKQRQEKGNKKKKKKAQVTVEKISNSREFDDFI